MTAGTSLVTGVDFVTVPTRDFAAAEEFYGNVLGLPRSARYGRFDGAEYEAGNLTLQVIDSSVMRADFGRSMNAVALHVEDVAAARAELESRGVRFHGDTIDSGVCHMALFSDPDGHALMLHHRYAPRTPEG